MSRHSLPLIAPANELTTAICFYLPPQSWALLKATHIFFQPLMSVLPIWMSKKNIPPNERKDHFGVMPLAWLCACFFVLVSLLLTHAPFLEVICAITTVAWQSEHTPVIKGRQWWKAMSTVCVGVCCPTHPSASGIWGHWNPWALPSRTKMFLRPAAWHLATLLPSPDVLF